MTAINATAIIRPVLRFSTIATLALVAAVAIAALTLYAPADSAACNRGCDVLNSVFTMSSYVPEIENLAASSQFPLTAGVAYFCALLFGVLIALGLAFTRFAKLNFEAMRVGGLKARLLRLGAYALWAAQFFVAAPAMNRQQFSFSFFQAVGSNRALLLVWMEGMYVLSIAVVVGMTAELSQYFRTRPRKCQQQTP